MQQTGPWTLGNRKILDSAIGDFWVKLEFAPTCGDDGSSKNVTPEGFWPMLGRDNGDCYFLLWITWPIIYDTCSVHFGTLKPGVEWIEGILAFAAEKSCRYSQLIYLTGVLLCFVYLFNFSWKTNMKGIMEKSKAMEDELILTPNVSWHARNNFLLITLSRSSLFAILKCTR